MQQPDRCCPPRRPLCWPHPQGRQTRRPTYLGADQVRVRIKPQDRQSAWPRNTREAARHCRRGDRMMRREFIVSLGGAAAWSFAARAQQKLPVIGFLGNDPGAPGVAAFNQGLRELGYIEGRNILIEYRWAEGRLERFPVLAAELVALKVDVIMSAGGSLGALAAKRATTMLPIVFGAVGNPVAEGLVTSLARPGSNVTGLSSVTTELVGKLLGLLKQAVPGVSRVALLFKPDSMPHDAKETMLKDADVSA